MAIVLYRKGVTHTIRGVECEAGRFDANELDHCLRNGWHTDPADMKVKVIDAIDKENKKAEVPTDAEVVRKVKKKGK